MAVIPRGQVPIWRPTPSQPRPPVWRPSPPMGPFPIGAAIRVARDHAKAFPLQRYYQITARVSGIHVSIQSDTFDGGFWAEYNHDHARAADHVTLVNWLVAHDDDMVRRGLIDHAISDSDIWWVVPFPRVPDMATMIGG